MLPLMRTLGNGLQSGTIEIGQYIMKTLIVADIHANLAAFKAVLDKEHSWDRFVFLGDAVLAGPEPDEVLSLLRELGGRYIMGNHDREVLELDPGEKAIDPGRKWAQWHRRSLSDRNLEFLASFVDACVLETQGFVMKAIHGVMPPEFGKRLWPDSPPEAFQYLGNKHVEPCILLGHSHVQFDCTCGNTRIINPGSVGAPYLGQPLACYAVIQSGQVELRATPYDIEKTCQSMKERAQGVVDNGFITDWTEGWRTGTLPKRYFIRDYSQLCEQGYR